MCSFRDLRSSNYAPFGAVRWIAAVSSHSIRVGVAQDNSAAGESLPAMMQAYRWRDPKTVMRYRAKLAAKSGASARLAARFFSQ